MKPKKSHPKTKPMTLDDFAVLIQKDLARMATKDDFKDLREDIENIREKMATKEDLTQLRAEVGIGFRNIEADMKMMTEVMVTKADLANTVTEEIAKSPYRRQVRDLDTRVRTVEGKLGIRPSRRAA